MAITSTEHIKIFEIKLETARASKPLILASADSVTSVVSEIEIFENISLPYLTGNITLLDDNDLYGYLNIMGSEKITISFGLDTNETTPMTKTFVLTRVIKSQRINDNSTMLVCDMIEDVGYYNFMKKFSKYYDGSGEQIIQTMVSEQINKPINTDLFSESHQAPFRYIVPYITTFDAVSAILGKITTQNGLPYFFHGSLNTDGFIFSDLESIIQAGAFNKGSPLEFSQGTTSDPMISKHSRAIYNFTNLSPLEDTLKMVQLGAVGSNLQVINAQTGNSVRSSLDATRVYNQLINYNIISKDQKIEHVDLLFEPNPSEEDGMKIRDYESKIFTYVESVPYPQSNLNGYSQETYFSDHVLKVIKKSVTNHIQKNIYSFNMAGLIWSGNNLRTSVGNLVEILVPSTSIPNDNSSQSAVIDQKRSGNFLILAKKHSIDVIGKRHNVTMEVGRVTNLENLS